MALLTTVSTFKVDASLMQSITQNSCVWHDIAMQTIGRLKKVIFQKFLFLKLFSYFSNSPRQKPLASPPYHVHTPLAFDQGGYRFENLNFVPFKLIKDF